MDILDDHQKDKMHEEILNKYREEFLYGGDSYEQSLETISEKIDEIARLLRDENADNIIAKEDFKTDVTRQRDILNTLSEIAPSVFLLSFCHKDFKKRWIEMADEWHQQGKLTEPVWNSEKLLADAKEVHYIMSGHVDDFEEDFHREDREVPGYHF